MSTLEDIRKSIALYIDEYGIKKAGVFGSYARGQESELSDIDLLFEFNKDFGLLGLSHLKLSLEEKLGKSVDILEFKSTDPLLMDNINKDLVILYEQR
jgi:predicted nucleotidyltransferase